MPSALQVVRRVIWCGTENGSIILYNSKTRVLLKEIRNQSVSIILNSIFCQQVKQPAENEYRKMFLVYMSKTYHTILYNQGRHQLH